MIPRELRTTPRFVGRKPELAQLERLFIGDPTPKVIAVISGMPGVGKSYLADHFARTHAAAFSTEILRLALHPVDRRSPEGLAEELASKFVPEIDRKQLPERISGVLLLIENVDSDTHATLVAELIRTFPAAKVIISGRVREFGSALGWPQIPLDRLDEATALELLAAWDCPPLNRRASRARPARQAPRLPHAGPDPRRRLPANRLQRRRLRGRAAQQQAPPRTLLSGCARRRGASRPRGDPLELCQLVEAVRARGRRRRPPSAGLPRQRATRGVRPEPGPLRRPNASATSVPAP